MSDVLARLKAEVGRDDVLRAVHEYGRLGPDTSSPSTGLAPAAATSWSGRNGPTLTRPSWARPTSWPRASAWPRVTSREARPGPSRYYGTWGSRSRKRNVRVSEAGRHGFGQRKPCPGSRQLTWNRRSTGPGARKRATRPCHPCGRPGLAIALGVRRSSGRRRSSGSTVGHRLRDFRG